MWIITNIGFYSIVEKPGDKQASTLTIRARVKSDLESLRDTYLSTLGPISEDVGTDYKYRAKAPRQHVAGALGQLVLDIDYDNFKNAVAKNQGTERSTLYHKLWDVLYQLQSTKPVKTSSTKTRKVSYGGVLLNSEQQILLRRPTNDYGGYVWTFPKGKEEPGSTPEETALREVKEETGYTAEIVGKIPGRFEGETGDTEYFLMRPLGEPDAFEKSETETVVWVSLDEAARRILKTKSQIGKKRDQAVLEKVIQYLRSKNER